MTALKFLRSKLLWQNFLCFLCGAGIILLPHLLEVQWEDKINYADVLNAFVTLIAAYWVGYILTKKSTDQRVEKDLLISYIREVLLILSSLEESIETCEFVIPDALSNEYKKWVSLFREINNKLYDFTEPLCTESA